MYIYIETSAGSGDSPYVRPEVGGPIHQEGLPRGEEDPASAHASAPPGHSAGDYLRGTIENRTYGTDEK